MKLYDTLSATKRDFSPADGKVKMYVCGITPYSASHIGHAMFSVIFDVVRRYLEYKGHEVVHVQNFTDIDDKMIKAAREQGVSVQELAENNIRAYLEETDALNVLRATKYPRATQEIPVIVEMIKALIDMGRAYSVDGDVYFRVRSDEDYGKLSRRTQESLRAGARVEIDEAKEDPADFALWKSQKPGEPAWDSPWGPGRPGWHIECSAMSLKYLGESLDIHGGGQDLIFPHHENELAQSESFTGKRPFVRFWLHNGLIQLGENKMSKSLGNIVTIREALKSSSSDALRLFFLNSHYRRPLAYGDETIEAQERAVERLRNALRPAESSIGAELDPQPYKERFIEAMDDDLNTPRALAATFDLASEINRGRESGQAVVRAQQTLREIAGVLGLTLEEPESQSDEDATPFIDLLVELRSDLRAAKRFDLADKVRDRLAALGVTLEDTPNGTLWRRKRP